MASPTVPIVSPPDGATISGTVTVTADASDDVGVAGYLIFRNGTQITTTVATSYSNTGLQSLTTYTISWLRII